MGNIRTRLAGRAVRTVAAASLIASLASCGVVAEQDKPGQGGQATATASSATPPASSAAAAPAPTATPTPTPAPTPGEGPACKAVRCTSVLVTGDMLVHTQLWEQA